MSDDGEKVVPLGVKFRPPPGDEVPTLIVAERYADKKCDHKTRWIAGDGLSGAIRDMHYLIREGETEVECGGCGAKLDPMFVLMQLARKESRWNQDRTRVEEFLNKAKDRSRTKCQHCDRMTKISR